MPILRIKKEPFYITISELSALNVFDKFVMYRDNSLRNRPLDKFDQKELTDFVYENISDGGNYKFLYVDLVNKEAECALTEMILYHVYFYCKNVQILGSNRTIDTTSDQLTLNDIIYPFISWNSEIIFRDLTIKSGDFCYTIDYNKVEKVNGFFREFIIVLKDATIKFSFGQIFFSPRQLNSFSPSINKFFKQWDENKPISRLLNSKDRMNYKDFAFYLNDKYMYSSYEGSRFYQDYATYKSANPEIFRKMNE